MQDENQSLVFTPDHVIKAAVVVQMCPHKSVNYPFLLLRQQGMEDASWTTPNHQKLSEYGE